MRYEHTDPERDPGWDYIDPEGTEHSGFPSIAMWTWIKKGYFHPDTKIREKHTSGWKVLKDAAGEIRSRALSQFAKEMLLQPMEGMWYWINPSTGQIDNQPYSGGDMVHYLKNGQLPPNMQLCQTVGQRGIPPRSQFRTLEQLVNEHIEKNLLTRRPSLQSEESCKENGNGVTGNSNGEQKRMEQPHQAGTEVHSETSSQPGVSNAPIQQQAPLEFEELQDRYRARLFGDDSLQWYIHVNNSVHGPYPSSDLLGWSQASSLPGEYKIKAVPSGGPKPADGSEFESFLELLEQIHNSTSFRS